MKRILTVTLITIASLANGLAGDVKYKSYFELQEERERIADARYAQFRQEQDAKATSENGQSAASNKRATQPQNRRLADTHGQCGRRGQDSYSLSSSINNPTVKRLRSKPSRQDARGVRRVKNSR